MGEKAADELSDTPGTLTTERANAPKRVLFVFNSRAGLRQAGCSEGAIVDTMRDWGWKVSSFACHGHDTIGEVKSELDLEKYDLVVGAGGDGTLNLIANALVERDVPLAIVPCGTANDLALTLGIPLDLEHALDLVRRGQPKSIDLGIVNGRYFLNVASVGLSARVAYGVRPESKQRWGKWAYAIEAFRQMRERKSERLDLCVDNSCETVDAYQVSVANGASFGGGWRVNQSATPDDGLLDIIVVEKGSGRRRFTRPRPIKPTPVQRIADRSMRLPELEIYSKRDLMANLDGEPLRFHPPLRFGVARHSLRVYAPERA